MVNEMEQTGDRNKLAGRHDKKLLARLEELSELSELAERRRRAAS